ncbi:anti-sigma factor family protein [Paenibacillus illinoisensis]|uniref:Anti-sigma-W factor RsiW n=1 Tax=Paenibacillus illinoisensis TaxID=59845 RepID=A0A2W0C684_9BACL|nr:anti-sigma factor [Paenibacillus illinoisensis]MBM6387251.1 zf-HC2 domain-containing protein [Paenibacillus sp.]PYY27517.1 Transmembrane anti-sigma factor [Paenibacillus illinoisensis]
MKCEEVVEWMHRYLDHDLGDAETAQMLQHVAQCPECAENFSLLRALSRELEDLPQVTPKFSLVDAIMPQLDAIDEARREQSSTIQEMTPVPAAFENLQRSSERKPKQKWLNSMVGRMSMGAAAAAVVLGVAIWGYEPEKVENAESMMLSSGSTQETGAVDQNPLSRELENDESFSPQNNSDPLMDDTENKSSMTEKTDPMTAPEENGPEQSPEPEVKDNQTSNQPGTTSETDNSTEARNTTPDASNSQKSPDQGQDTQPKDQDSSIAAVPPADENENESTETSDGRDSESYNTQGIAPEVEMKEPTEDNQSSGTDSGTAAPNGSKEFVAPNQGITSTMTSKEWSSPDGSYVVMLIDNQLSVYSKSATDSDVLNLVEQRNLEGTLKTAGWSSDSTSFNYETDKDGTTVKNSFTVPSASSATSTK